MRVTTANFKHSNYNEDHEIYVGTHTGSFKKLFISQENPHHQINLQNLNNLSKDSRITALNYGNNDRTEILIGRANKFVKIYDINTNDYTSNLEVADTPIVGLGRYNDTLIVGFGTGKVQILHDPEPITLITGDNMSKMRQCSFNNKLIATGGKERQNHLKLYDLETMKKVFNSKNLPNDYLQLEIPIWDTDIEFLDTNLITTCSRYGYVRIYDTRIQRRPIHKYMTENQMSFSCITAQDNRIYVGTTMGALKSFDTRNLKTFLHTYKGFTGSLSDICLDDNGKYLISGSLDRYIRVHHAEERTLLYQCYVKSKVTKVLVRNSKKTSKLNKTDNDDDDCVFLGEENSDDDQNGNGNTSDPEYDAIFNKMETISEADELKPAQKRKIVNNDGKVKKKKQLE